MLKAGKTSISSCTDGGGYPPDGIWVFLHKKAYLFLTCCNCCTRCYDFFVEIWFILLFLFDRITAEEFSKTERQVPSWVKMVVGIARKYF